MNIEEIVWWETRETVYHGVCNTLRGNLDIKIDRSISGNEYAKIIKGVYTPVADSINDLGSFADISYEY
jgi:hypothetical protein